jgi:methionyl-tRNA formyltransferase
LKWPLKTYIILSSKKWNESTTEILKNNFPAYNWIAMSNKEEFNLKKLSYINPDKIFIAHWSYIIPETIFSTFKCIVFHMTDLPYGRGGSPLQNLIERGHKKTKISAIKVVEELDAGPIFHKEELSLSGTAEEIFLRANTIIIRMIEKIVLNNLSSKPQTGMPVIFKRRTPKMSSIEDLNDIESIFNHIRMLDAEGYPHAFIETKSFKFEFTRAALKADKSIIADVRITKK